MVKRSKTMSLDLLSQSQGCKRQALGDTDVHKSSNARKRCIDLSTRPEYFPNSTIVWRQEVSVAERLFHDAVYILRQEFIVANHSTPLQGDRRFHPPLKGSEVQCCGALQPQKTPL